MPIAGVFFVLPSPPTINVLSRMASLTHKALEERLLEQAELKKLADWEFVVCGSRAGCHNKRHEVIHCWIVRSLELKGMGLALEVGQTLRHTVAGGICCWLGSGPCLTMSYLASPPLGARHSACPPADADKALGPGPLPHLPALLLPGDLRHMCPGARGALGCAVPPPHRPVRLHW